MQRSKTNRPKKYAWRWQRLYKLSTALLLSGGLGLLAVQVLQFFDNTSTVKLHNSLKVFCLTLLPLLIMHFVRLRAIRQCLISPTPHDIPVLIELWEDNYEQTRNKIQKAIAELLVEAETDDFDLLNTAHRQFLNDALYRSDTELVKAVLTAWERAGDSRAIPFVEKLAAGRASAVGNPGIQQQAQECLIILQERAAVEQNADTLLRASTAATTPDILLRPAYTAPQSAEAEAQLLRATTEKEDNPTP